MVAAKGVRGLAAAVCCFVCLVEAIATSDCGRPQDTSPSPPSSGDVIPAWHAVVYDTADGVGKHICAGALIDAQYVLVAEHCFYGPSGNLRPETDFTVGVGKVSRVLGKEEISSQTRTVKHIHFPQGAGVAHSNDLALLRLNEAVFLNDRVWPICIDWKGDQLPLKNGDKGSMAGFGSGGSLEYFPLRLLGKDLCKKNAIVKESQFCAENDAGPAAGEIDSACGFARKSQDRWFLRGVYYKNSKNTHLFSNVTGYVDWMAHIISNAH